jgi:hypothetical protein
MEYSWLHGFAPRDMCQFDERFAAELTAIQRNRGSLPGFDHAANLPLRRARLS